MKSHLSPFFGQKIPKKTRCTLQKKPLRFVKIVAYLWAVTSKILQEISPFALFFVKNQVKKHAVPSKKTVAYCENCRFFDGGNF